MPDHMTKALTGAVALGLALFAFAASGIASLAGDLESATPPRVPAPASEEVSVESQRVDCPFRERTPERRRL